MDVKRKTRGSGDLPLPPAKRHTQNTSAVDAQRREIAHIYAAYDALSNRTGGDTEFTTLLKAAEGSGPAQRLAASLLPKFAPRFPAHLNDTASAVMGLATLSLSDSLSAGTRYDAASGLAVLLHTAQAAGAEGVAADLVRFALRQLRTQSTVNGWVEVLDDEPTLTSPNGDGTGAPTAILHSALWAFLEEAFRCVPRVVVATCTHVLSEASQDMHAVVIELLRDHFLAPLPPPPPRELDFDFLTDDEQEKGSQTRSGDSRLCSVVLGALTTQDARAVTDDITRCVSGNKAPPEAAALLQDLLPTLPHAPGRCRHTHQPPLPKEHPSPSPARKVSGSRREEGGGRKRRAFSPGVTPDVRPPPDRATHRDDRAGERGGEGCRPVDAPPLPPSPAAAGTTFASNGYPHDQPPLPPYERPPPPLPRVSPESEKEEGEMELDEGEIPPVGGSGVGAKGAGGKGGGGGAQQLPRPGGRICLAAPCLHLTNLPRGAREPEVASDCARYARVLRVLIPLSSSAPHPSGRRSSSQEGEAFVSCPSLRDAARVYEGVLGAEGRGVMVAFCEGDLVGQHGTGPVPPTHVWVAHQAGGGDEADLLRRLRRGGAPAPELTLRVAAGRASGVLLSFETPSAAGTALAALHDIGPGPDAIGPVPPLPLPAAHTNGSRGEREREGYGGGAPHREYRDREPFLPRDRERGARDRDGYPPRLSPPLSRDSRDRHGGDRGGDIPEYATCTLWVGQVPKGGAAEAAVLDAFASFGALASHRFMRSTGCAFVDYEHVKGATGARFGLDGARVAGSVLRVAFKDENRFWKARGGPGGGPRGNGGPPPMGGPPQYREGPGGRGGRPWPLEGGRFPRSRSRSPPLPRDMYSGGGGGGSHRGPGGGGVPDRGYSPGPGGGFSRGGYSRSPPDGRPGYGPPVGASRDLRSHGYSPGPGPIPSLPQQQHRSPGPPGGRSLHSTPVAPQHAEREGRSPSVPGVVNVNQPQQEREGSGARPRGTPPAAAAAGPTPPWRGVLAKNKAVQCGIVCIDGPTRSVRDGGGQWAAAEPQGWPATLDVAQRTDFAYLCGTLYPSLPPGVKAVRRITADATETKNATNIAAFSAFVAYLRGKDRAGVVALRAMDNGAAPARLLYLIPPSEGVCGQLGVAWPVVTGGESLLALVVPAAAK